MSVKVELVEVPTDEVAAAVGRLLPQLSQSAGPFDRPALERLVGGDSSRLVVARLDGRIVGMLTLVIYPLPTGVRARIEDVVVDEQARGQGIGAALTREAVRLAGLGSARTVDLTSRPSRTAANRLYERMGFQRRESNVYRLEII
jgi:ribosomal protein S18 acetylase RimI-like enzyme